MERSPIGICMSDALSPAPMNPHGYRDPHPPMRRSGVKSGGSLNGAPGQRFASTAGGVKVERPERAVAREDERP